MYAAREGPHSPRTAQAECGPTLLLFLGGHLGSLQSWWVQIFCNSIRQKKTCVLPCKAPGLSQDYFNFACFEGSGERLANLWQSWKAGVLVMHHNCKIMLPAFHVHSKSSLPLHPRRDGIIRNFLKLPLLFFLSSFLTLTPKKRITPLNVVWAFTSKYLSVWIGPKTNGITKQVTLLCNRWWNYLCR